MICEACEGEDEGVRCPACKHPVDGDRTDQDGQVVRHYAQGAWMIFVPWATTTDIDLCKGTGADPEVVRHPGCKGCPCQHKPLGSWKG